MTIIVSGYHFFSNSIGERRYRHRTFTSLVLVYKHIAILLSEHSGQLYNRTLRCKLTFSGHHTILTYHFISKQGDGVELIM